MMNWSENDKKQMDDLGISLSDLSRQLEIFKKGFKPITLERPCILDDGIIRVDSEEINFWSAKFENLAKQSVVVKFVPASGAASRMFKHLHQYDAENPGTLMEEFENRFSDLPFSDLVNSAVGEKASIKDKINYLFSEDGLGYASLPKGLVHFHRYPFGLRTAFEEHLFEAIQYAQGRSGAAIHYTVPVLFREYIEMFLQEKAVASQLTDMVLTYSVQQSSTDTLAVLEDNSPYRDSEGRLLFRPGGHGALIHNLNALDADIIFIKNIDNILPETQREVHDRWKKVLAGILAHVQEVVFEVLKALSEERDLPDSWMQVAKWLGIPAQSEGLFDQLNRPIRVCGMVKNQGEPGGGPFWVNNGKRVSAQIVEKDQIDVSSKEQMDLLASSTHFNPVDLVCSTKDFNGNKFDLLEFVDHDTSFITSKSVGEANVKALELPGLWNGAMAHWNTLFVEVPLETFNPVKTVNDLLRPSHQV